MILIPAIDIKGSKVVRLFQGKFSEVTEYSQDPHQIALKWQSLGAAWIHVIDLDGAKDGVMANMEIIGRIAQEAKARIEVGGGIRNEKKSRLSSYFFRAVFSGNGTQAARLSNHDESRFRPGGKTCTRRKDLYRKGNDAEGSGLASFSDSFRQGLLQPA